MRTLLKKAFTEKKRSLEKSLGKKRKKNFLLKENRLSKLGQAEIIGLAILVVLLVFILIVALSFTYKDNEKDDTRISLVANSLLNALIKQQGKVDIKDLIYNCYENVEKRVSDCDNLNKEVNKIISLSLGKRDYFMRIKTEDTEFFKIGNCNKGIESVPYRFKREGITFTASLRLC